MYSLLKRLLFRLDPEKAHHLTFQLITSPIVTPFLKWMYKHSTKGLEKEVFGLKFKSPVGLAAGLDKDAIAFNELGNLGFGFIEIGTVTPLAQLGNDKPRLFRLVKDNALINRMGFNNKGVKHAANRLKNRQNPAILIGGNIGKNKVTPNEMATNDYVICFNELFEVVDYFVVNVSSPNTPGLRDLQDKEPLKALLDTLMLENSKRSSPKPILLKIAPDLTNSQLDDIIWIVEQTKIAGVIATNTTLSRTGLNTPDTVLTDIGAGGLSGKPLKNRSTEVIRYLKANSQQKFPIIGVGGIHSPEDAIEKLKAGADLIQLYTGFIYEGPSLIKKIHQSLQQVPV